jgi:DNA-nicking Smr family endonuclease
MSKRVPPQEAELFRTAVGEVRRLEHDRVEPPARRPPPIPQQRLRDEAAVVRDMLSDPLDPAELETGEELSFARPGLQHTVLRKLRRGQYSVEKELDLHGLTVEEARQALAAFLHHCTAGRLRCVRIIHGKGNSSFNKQPVLKGRVNHWLRHRSEILAFCSARPVDGGTGALYVLLRRRGER